MYAIWAHQLFRTQIEAPPGVFVVKPQGFEPVTPTLRDVPRKLLFSKLVSFHIKTILFIYRNEITKCQKSVRFTKFSVVLQVLRMWRWSCLIFQRLCFLFFRLPSDLLETRIHERTYSFSRSHPNGRGYIQLFRANWRILWNPALHCYFDRQKMYLSLIHISEPTRPY